MTVGKLLRMGRITRSDGRTLIIALDHGSAGITEGIEDIADVVGKVIEGGADAILVNFGIATKVANIIRGRASLVLGIPYDPRYVKMAVKIGADAIKTTYFGPVPLSEERTRQIAEVSLHCQEWGMPFMVEVVPTDDQGQVVYDVKKVMQAARIGSELGGDLIKTLYVEPPSEYRKVVAACGAPIVVLGGPKLGSTNDILKMVEESLEAGAIGGTIGRNIFQQGDPRGITASIVRIIHGSTQRKSSEDVLI